MVISSLLFIASTAWSVKVAHIPAPKITGAPVIARNGVQVLRDKKPFADVWLRAECAPVVPRDTDRVNFASLGEGSVAAVVRLHKPWRDYRDREVPAGTYLLRYAIQPRLKDHAGTAPWRDFLLFDPSPPREHPFVMALVPMPSTRNDQAVIEARPCGVRVGLVIEGTGELGM